MVKYLSPCLALVTSGLDDEVEAKSLGLTFELKPDIY